MRHLYISYRYVILTIAALVSVLLVFGITTQTSESASGPNCGPGYAVLGGGGSSTTTLIGLTNLKLAVPTTETRVITKVVFRANDKPIGKALANGTYTWNMPWETSLHPAGQVYVDAEVYYANQSSYCAANGFTSQIATQPPGELQLVVNPQAWEGPKSFSVPINAVTWSSINSSFDPTIYALFSWQTSIGTFSSLSNNTAQFSTGTTEGTGAITVRAIYGGQQRSVSIPISVKSINSPLPEPTTTTTTTTSTTQTTSSGTQTDTETAATREATLQNNPVSQNCVITAIGEERYNAINSGTARPTTDEVQKFKACFASSNYILPYNFAPIEPTKVSTLNKTDKVTVRTPSNTVLKNEDATEKEVLTFSGTALPNSIVMIYVFSNPLVLTTTANDNGEWTYTLEDPIEPGDHEVYTVIDRGDGVYERSDPIAFSIVGTAEAAGLESNPSGLSLRLSDQVTPDRSRRSLVMYTLASIATLVAVGAGVLVMLRMRQKPLTSTGPASPPQDAVVVSTPDTQAAPEDAQTKEKKPSA